MYKEHFRAGQFCQEEDCGLRGKFQVDNNKINSYILTSLDKPDETCDWVSGGNLSTMTYPPSKELFNSLNINNVKRWPMGSNRMKGERFCQGQAYGDASSNRVEVENFLRRVPLTEDLQDDSQQSSAFVHNSNRLCNKYESDCNKLRGSDMFKDKYESTEGSSHVFAYNADGYLDKDPKGEKPEGREGNGPWSEPLPEDRVPRRDHKNWGKEYLSEMAYKTAPQKYNRRSRTKGYPNL